MRRMLLNDRVATAMGLTDIDYERAAPFIPETVMHGSGEENGWVHGVKAWRMGKTEPGDPSLGGGMVSAAIKGFRAAKSGKLLQDLK